MSATTTHGTCDRPTPSGVLECDLGSLDRGTAVTLELAVTQNELPVLLGIVRGIPLYEPILNVATADADLAALVQGGSQDRYLANNSVGLETAILPKQG